MNRLLISYACCFLATGIAAGAPMLTVGNATLTKTTDNTADFSNPKGAGTTRSEYRSETQVFDNGGSVEAVRGNSVIVSARFTAEASVQAFKLDPINAKTGVYRNNYEFTFDVNIPDGKFYKVDVTSEFLGSFTEIIPANGFTIASAAIADSGFFASNLQFDKSLKIPTYADSFPDQPDSPFDNVTVSTFAGPIDSDRRNVSWRLEWDYNVKLASIASDTKDGPDVAWRLGLDSGFANSAGTYPGVGDREMDLDGHWITVKVTVLPEVGSLLLGGAGLASGVLIVHRRRRADP